MRILCVFWECLYRDVLEVNNFISCYLSDSVLLFYTFWCMHLSHLTHVLLCSWSCDIWKVTGTTKLSNLIHKTHLYHL